MILILNLSWKPKNEICRTYVCPWKGKRRFSKKKIIYSRWKRHISLPQSRDVWRTLCGHISDICDVWRTLCDILLGFSALGRFTNPFLGILPLKRSVLMIFLEVYPCVVDILDGNHDVLPARLPCSENQERTTKEKQMDWIAKGSRRIANGWQKNSRWTK